MPERHAPSDRFRQLAPSADRLGYLVSDDGFWADFVLAERAFLEERGYPAEWVTFHQQGDSLSFGGPRGSIVFEFFPDADYISARARLSGGVLTFEGDLDVLARIQNPHVVLPPKLPLDRASIERMVAFWATTLRSADPWL
jgi:hypothetical protein